MEGRITDACMRPRCAHVLRGCARAWVRACFGAHASALEPCARVPSAWTACGLGAQAFESAAAFNANIGAWNTASVSNMQSVCAASGPGGAHNGGCALPGFVRCGAAGCARRHRRCARVCAHVQALALRWAHGCRYGRAEGRFGTCIWIKIYIFVCVCERVFVTRVYIHHPCICICENRPALCMRAPVCDG